MTHRPHERRRRRETGCARPHRRPGLYDGRPDLAAMLAELLELVAGGRLNTCVAETMPLDEVPAAYARLARGHQIGKLVCDVAGSVGA
ncbi:MULTISPECIES: zinc-binding dehydrogenase [unclassified Actinomyces]|uniref:zinc-binding dehydrogenase n=1 Tax=unclassified Actinomyces TaxID=2609248 RepID=UPI001373C225|nr:MULTISPECIES: zinc-binding dehydrogenase [unclassified Actinomyces]QHO91140.1 hypothetical protein CWT12_07120 [Actinomyces sp. 432]